MKCVCTPFFMNYCYLHIISEIHILYKEVAKRKVKFLDSSYRYLCVLFKYLHLHKSKHRVFLKDQLLCRNISQRNDAFDLQI